ncbi:MAG: carboxypeptidase regulatory-like domain-containing protein, partial [Gemmatimonadales bacterium]|nr:carboxypeptidase regulatory-like domain-containing protein [Gemmatimonadales bacterium]MBP6571478.1 carboxypeptidase regulatory-like domain-containing protein [Gemmatimonadales bacterium]
MSLRSFARFASSLASLLLLVGLAARPLAAQSTVDWITGSVVDGTGKPVIGATIEAYSIELDVTKKATANDKG